MSDDKSKLTLIEATVEINRLKKYVLELEACIKDMKKNSGGKSDDTRDSGLLEKYELLFKSTNLGIIRRNHEGKITYANPAASRILGVSINSLLNVESFEPEKRNILPDGTQMGAESHPAYIALLTGKEILNSIIGVFNQQLQSYIWINLTATPLVNKETNLAEEVFTIFEDITQKLESEKLLKLRESQSKALLDTIPDLIFRLSRKGEVVEFHGNNDEALISGRNIHGKNISEIFPFDLSGIFISKIENVLELNNTQVFDFNIRHNGLGLKHYEIRLSPSGEDEVMAIIRDFTEQKKALRKVEETKRRMTTLLGNLSGMVYRCLADSEWTMLFVSEGVKNLTGYSSEELNYNTSISYNEVIVPEDRDYVRRIVGQGARLNQRFTMEYRIITKTGELKWVFEQGLTIKDHKNKPLFIEGYITDITDRKIAEQKLNLNEAKFRLLFNSLTDAVFVHPFNENIIENFVEVNDFAISRYGYSWEELTKLSHKDLVSGMDLFDPFIDRINKIIKKKGIVVIELLHQTKSGEIFPVELHASLVELNNQRYVQSVVRDISDRKKAESELKHKSEIESLISTISADFVRASIDEIESLIDKSIQVLGEFINSDRSYIYLLKENGAVLERTNSWYKNGEAMQFPHAKYLSSESMQWWLERFQNHEHFQVCVAEKFPAEPFSGINPDPRMYVKSFLSFPILAHDSLLGAVFFDTVFEENKWDSEDINLLKTFADILAGVINRKNFEQQLIYAKEKAEVSDQLKSTFLASMSHELRTPLNAIIGFSSLVNSNSPIDKIVKWNQIVKQSGKHLLQIIESIFDVSLLQAKEAKVKIEQFSLTDLFATLQQYVKTELKKHNKKDLNVHLVNFPDSKELFVESDRTKVTQVLTNLLNNAIKYTEKGQIEYGYKIEEANVLFYVSDTGIGISPEHKGIVFDIFRQVEDLQFDLQSGVGLGLAICKEISILLEAELWLESEKDIGSNFYFRLSNVVVPEKHHDKQVQNLSKPPLLFRGTILVVEDIEFNYLLIEEILAPTSAKVIWAKNGAEAVKMVREKIKIDLILMDIKMPVMDGYEAMKQIQEIKPDIPVIAQTAYAFEEDRKKINENGFKDYISKPIDKTILYHILNRFIRRDTENNGTIK